MSHPKKHNPYPPWSPRFWNGMSLMPYFQLLAENQFQIHPFRIPMFVLGTAASCFNSVMATGQSIFQGWRIEQSSPHEPPIFIVGHWRSGTTLMHELLTMDERFAYPSNFDVFAPRHLLITRPFLRPLINLLLPGKRPMDAMSLGADSPQEDDFALVSLGAPTPYRDIAFPNRRFKPAERKQNVNAHDLSDRTRRAMQYFVKVLTMQYKKRLVMKSPPHTARLQDLSQWFPDAKFIHLSRNPYQIVPSTLKLWKALDWTQGFQIPKYSDDQLLEYVFEQQEKMYSAYELQSEKIPQQDLIEIRFEDLVAQPVAVTKHIYEKWSLPGFDQFQSKIEHYFERTQNVKPSSETTDPVLRALIAKRWNTYFERFGYRV